MAIIINSYTKRMPLNDEREYEIKGTIESVPFTIYFPATVCEVGNVWNETSVLAFFNAQYQELFDSIKETNDRKTLRRFKNINHSGVVISENSIDTIFNKIDTWFPDGQVVSPDKLRKAIKFLIKLSIQTASKEGN